MIANAELPAALSVLRIEDGAVLGLAKDSMGLESIVHLSLRR